MNINDTLLNLLDQIPSAVVGAIIGFLIKSFLERRKKKKELHAESLSALEKANDVISSKMLSIRRDLVLVNPIADLRAMRKNLDEYILKSNQEIVDLGTARIIDNCDDINKINTDEFSTVFTDAAKIIEEFKKQCRDLKRILMYKSSDESKIELLDEVEGNLKELFSDLMGKIREIY